MSDAPERLRLMQTMITNRHERPRWVSVLDTDASKELGVEYIRKDALPVEEIKWMLVRNRSEVNPDDYVYLLRKILTALEEKE